MISSLVISAKLTYKYKYIHIHQETIDSDTSNNEESIMCIFYYVRD